MTSSNDAPKATLYSFPLSLWATVPRIGLIEKGYAPTDVEVKTVDLLKAENYAPQYLRINPNGTIPTLVVPLSETTSPEVATKFRALTDTVSILDFLDNSRSQLILELKGDKQSTAAPKLAPATVEGMAANDELIKMVHHADLDGNFLQAAGCSPAEVAALQKSIVSKLITSRMDALQRHRAEVSAASSSSSSNPDANPRSAAHNESLLKWYEGKIAESRPLYDVYGPKPTEAAVSAHIQVARMRFAKLAIAIDLLETKLLKGPYALGDQMSLADIHLMAWFARIVSIAEQKAQASGSAARAAAPSSSAAATAAANSARPVKDLEALEALLKSDACAASGASCVLGPKVKAYWQALQARPSF